LLIIVKKIRQNRYPLTLAKILEYSFARYPILKKKSLLREETMAAELQSSMKKG